MFSSQPTNRRGSRERLRLDTQMKGLLKIAGLLGILGGLFLLERRCPLRAETESKARRNGRNLAVASLGALTIHFAESPVLYPLAKAVRRRRWGFLNGCDCRAPSKLSPHYCCSTTPSTCNT